MRYFLARYLSARYAEGIMMDDFLYKGRIADRHINFAYAATNHLCSDAVIRHNCDPVGAHILSRALISGVLVAATFNEHERLNLQWSYKGLLRSVVVDAGPDGTVRGLISPAQLQKATSTQELFGDNGLLTLIRSADGQVRASGTVEAPFRDVAEDLAYGISLSDQVETGLVAMVGFAAPPEEPVRICRGLIIQAAPEADLIQFQRWRERLEIESFRQLMAREHEPDNLIEDILHALDPEEGRTSEVVISESIQPVFQCSCSPVKMAVVLRALSREEQVELMQKNEEVTVTCNFCNRRFTISPDEYRPWFDPE